MVGLRLTMTDRTSYDPTTSAVRLLVALEATQREFFAFRPAQFDRLAGGPELRQRVERGDPAAGIVSRWPERLRRFREWRRPFLLYPE